MDKNIITEQWMECWEQKHFPIRVDSYEDWRKFRDFWYDNPLADINKVVILYEAANSCN